MTHITAKTIRRMLLTGPALAAVVLLGGLRGAQAGVDVWTTSGPEGGTIQALAIDPQNPDILYAAVEHTYSPASRDVYKSTDAGRTWRAVVIGLPGSGALTIDPQTPTTLYLGGYGSVYKSKDGGGTWTAASTGLRADVFISGLVVDPQTPATLYASARYWAGSDGVYKSTDGGGSWNTVNTGLPTPSQPGWGFRVETLAIDPQTPTTLYVGGFEGLSGRVYKSTDGGGSWSPVNTGGAEIYSLAIDPQTPTTLYVGTSYTNILKSTDGGSTWREASAGLPAGSFSYSSLRSIAIDPRTPTILYAATDVGVFKSVNGGDDWNAVNSPVVTPLAIDPRTPTTLYGGSTFHGIFKSTDGGAGWGAVNTGLTNSWVADLVINPQTPTTLYATAYASAYDQGLFKSTDGTASWVKVGQIPNGSGVLAIDPQTPTTLYAGTQGEGPSGYILKSIDGGDTWSRHNIGQFLSNVFLINTITALAIDPVTPTTVYAGTRLRGVFKSTDGGAGWNRVTALDTSVTALVIDPQTPTTVYVGTGNRGVLKSVDGGATWSTLNAGLTDLNIWALAIDPRTPTTLYVGTSNSGVFKSTDGAGSWVNAGFTDLRIRALAVDPQTPATLYVVAVDTRTGSGGVFKSTDGGASWSALNAELTNPQVSALVIDPQTPTTLYAGTTTGVFALQQTTVSIATTVNFDSPAPTGGGGPFDGVFGGIDFGAGQWAWEGPYGADPTNNIYFADSSGTSRSFAFSPEPRVLNSMSVFSPEPGTLTLSDDAGQTCTREVTTGSMQLVTTGWTRPSTTVTVSFTAGWALGVDDIAYTTAP